MATIRLRRGTTGPTGLTLAEPAFDYSNNKLFVGLTGSAVWVGGEVDNNTALGSSQVKIPTQFAVKTYVDNNVAGGAVSTLNGLTGAVFIGAGTGISVAVAAKGITLTNTGVQSLSAGSFTNLSGSTGAVTINNAGVWAFNGSTGIVSGVGSLAAGSFINLSGTTGAITVNNAGVHSVNGTTGAITNVAFTNTANTFTLGNSFNAGLTASDLTVTNAATVGGNLSVTGNLTVNGTTTYVNSTVTEIADPIITLGWTGGVGGMPIDDNKDRGIAFKYNSSGGRTGFFGYDDSTGYFTFVPVAGITAEVVGGSVGTAQLAGVISQGLTLTLTGNASNAATIQLSGNATVPGAEHITLNAGVVRVSGGNPTTSQTLLEFTSAGNNGQITVPTFGFGALRTFTLPDHTGTFVVPSDLGTNNFILKANGTTSQPTWINPNAAGFTANMATNVAGGAAGNLHYQTAANTTGFVTNAGVTGSVLSYNTTSNTPVFVNPNATGFTAFAATNIGGGAAGSLPYNTAATTTTFLSIGTSGFVLTSTGSAPQWSDLTGLTAGNAQTVTVASDTADTTCFVTFINAGTNSNQAMKYNSSLTYNAVTNYLEANIDGGSY